MDSHSSDLDLLSPTFKKYPGLTRTPEMTYPILPQGYKAPHHAMFPPTVNHYGYNHHPTLGRRASWQYPCETDPRSRSQGIPRRSEYPEDIVSHLAGSDPRALENLRDRIVALQMQNIELNLFLKKEELRRKEAEEEVRREKQYVRKLQDSLHDLSSSTLVMDPLTYKQVADKYIASRKKPVRRTHTCSPYLGPSDLVCDSKRLQNENESKNATSLFEKDKELINISSHSIPVKPTSETTMDRKTPPEVPYSQAGWSSKDSSLSPLEYQELLQSLDNLEVTSSPP